MAVVERPPPDRRQISPAGSDFVCLRLKLIVEADGGQHAESAYDLKRDRWLAKEGYAVVRYSNVDILKNSDGVLSDLLARIERCRESD